MKCLYWNLRGLANSPTKLALKKLLSKYKPDVCFISEPWMLVSDLSPRWLLNLGLKVFCVNDRNSLIPNLWCLCPIHLSPNLISVDDQQISIQIDISGKPFGFTGVYASTCYIKRRQLWSAISNIQTQHKLSWCCIGDFNTILGSHEHQGSHTPARLPMLDFQQWSDVNNLFHLPTRGSAFTWTNGRRGRNNTRKRLDRSIVNQLMIDNCESLSACTLTKLRSDHFPILFEL